MNNFDVFLKIKMQSDIGIGIGNTNVVNLISHKRKLRNADEWFYVFRLGGFFEKNGWGEDLKLQLESILEAFEGFACENKVFSVVVGGVLDLNLEFPAEMLNFFCENGIELDVDVVA